MKIHFVKDGDTLYALSQKYGVSVDAIVAANPLIHNPDELVVGLKVKIPESKATGPVQQPKSKWELTKPKSELQPKPEPQLKSELQPKPEPQLQPQQNTQGFNVKKQIIEDQVVQEPVVSKHIEKMIPENAHEQVYSHLPWSDSLNHPFMPCPVPAVEAHAYYNWGQSQVVPAGPWGMPYDCPQSDFMSPCYPTGSAMAYHYPFTPYVHVPAMSAGYRAGSDAAGEVTNEKETTSAEHEAVQFENPPVLSGKTSRRRSRPSTSRKPVRRRIIKVKEPQDNMPLINI